MKHNRNSLASAIHLALGAGMIAGMAVSAAPVAAQEVEEEALTEDRIVVTGTRLGRTALEGALPVTVIDRDAIELSGKTSVADLIQNLPYAASGSFRPASGSAQQSFGGINLRGLGGGRTLVLIDGRRAPNAPNVGGTNFAQDLNSIPLGAVERVEILSDGASAIYGADAVGGVVNIITRRDFSGGEVMYGTSDSANPGGETTEAHALMGIAGDLGNIMVGASWNKRDIVFQREREWSRGGASSFSNNFVRPTPRVDDADVSDPTQWAWGFNNYYDPEEFGFLPSVPGEGCTGPGFNVFPSGICGYDFTLQAADEAELENQSLFFRSSLDIHRDWTLNLDASMARVKSFGRYAPVPSSPFPNGAIFLAPGTPNHPATSPEDGGLNPNWQDYQSVADEPVHLQHRFAALGPRDTFTDSPVYDIAFSLLGEIADWDVEFGFRRTESDYNELGYNYVVGGLAQQFITSGAYNIYDPFSVSDDIANASIATTSRDSNFTMREFFALGTTDVAEIQHGFVSVAVGGEYRYEDFVDQYDSLSEGGQVVGSSGNSAAGDRTVAAVFAEVQVPLLENLELNVAARYDDYSDFGTAFSPKVALRFQPIDEVILRASYGEGFRAPPLTILAQQPSFGAASVVDAQTCIAAGFGPDCTENDGGGSIQITSYSIANPNADSEDSEQIALGVAVQPTEWLSASLDYWNIKVSNTVTSFTAQGLINCLLGTSANCPDGLSELPAGETPPVPQLGLGVARNPDTGAILYAQTGFGNLGSVEREGLDMDIQTNFRVGAGVLSQQLLGSYLLTAKSTTGGNFAGEEGIPRWRANFINRFDWGDFSFGWNMNYIGAQRGAFSPAQDRTNSFITHDLQANYNTPWDARVTIGVDNLADRLPPLDPGLLRGFNTSLYNPYGRVSYVRYTQRF